MKSRRIIFLGVAVAVVAGWLFLLYLPALKQQKQLTSKISDARTQLDQYNLTLSQLPIFVKTRQDLQVKLAEANSSLYAKTDLVRLFDDIRQTAGAHGLRVTEITPPISELLELNKTTPGSSEPLFLSMTLSVTGNYLDFGRFVEQVEQAPYFRAVKSCTVIASADGSGKVMYSLGFKALLGGTAEGI